MKYIVVLGDGMADLPIEEIEGKTPLGFAKTPMMDLLSKQSEIGLVETIPEGMSPGSDTANLSVLGYDPRKYYSGRSPLEALSIGIPMKETDIAIRCNLVTISDEDGLFEEKTILDHSSSEISTEDCKILLDAVREELELASHHFYLGTSYRHCLIWEGGEVVALTPPHDILERKIGAYLPENLILREMMKKSHEILRNHPLNLERKKQGLNPANCCWFWGAGTKPMLTSFEEKTGKKGIMISAVDLLKGIAVGAGMMVASVEGANGGLHTNYEGKTDAAIEALTVGNCDFAYIHVEAPDEMGHQGSLERKIQAIEFLDEKVIGRIYKKLKDAGVDFRLLIMPDHPTPISIRTHTSDPVPYLLYDSTALQKNSWNYNEEEARRSHNRHDKGYEMIDYLFSK